MERVILAGAENVSVSSVGVPVVASGGAGRPEHLVEAFRDAKADATIVAGMVHTEGYTIAEIKKAPVSAAISARICW